MRCSARALSSPQSSLSRPSLCSARRSRPCSVAGHFRHHIARTHISLSVFEMTYYIQPDPQTRPSTLRSDTSSARLGNFITCPGNFSLPEAFLWLKVRHNRLRLHMLCARPHTTSYRAPPDPSWFSNGSLREGEMTRGRRGGTRHGS